MILSNERFFAFILFEARGVDKPEFGLREGLSLKIEPLLHLHQDNEHLEMLSPIPQVDKT